MQRVRGWLWPYIGWRRAGRYLLMRVQRMPGTPHSIAAGLAAGAAVSFTPFLGFHFLLAFVLAWLTRGNLLAAAIGTAVGNPWTFPFMFTATYTLGCYILGQPPYGLRHILRLDLDTLFDKVRLLLWPMVIGSVPFGAAAWALTYFPAVRAVRAVQARRRRRLEERLRRTARPATLEVEQP
ncbi:MAG TPA: DUF2062 domain-containing protein [Geminicoccaceae bacterium]|nr:DUF2062 domain-containing protein [Geminicoccaceae bacterium]